MIYLQIKTRVFKVVKHGSGDDKMFISYILTDVKTGTWYGTCRYVSEPDIMYLSARYDDETMKGTFLTDKNGTLETL